MKKKGFALCAFGRSEGGDYADAGDADIGRVGAGPYRVRKLGQGGYGWEHFSLTWYIC